MASLNERKIIIRLMLLLYLILRKVYHTIIDELLRNNGITWESTGVREKYFAWYPKFHHVTKTYVKKAKTWSLFKLFLRYNQ